MKCQKCVDQGNKSTVYPHGGTTMLMGFSPYYDEDGIYHYHDPNRSSRSYSCSNRHEWTETLFAECPAGDYGGQEHSSYPTDMPVRNDIVITIPSYNPSKPYVHTGSDLAKHTVTSEKE